MAVQRNYAVSGQVANQCYEDRLSRAPTGAGIPPGLHRSRLMYMTSLGHWDVVAAPGILPGTTDSVQSGEEEFPVRCSLAFANAERLNNPFFRTASSTFKETLAPHMCKIWWYQLVKWRHSDVTKLGRGRNPVFSGISAPRHRARPRNRKTNLKPLTTSSCAGIQPIKMMRNFVQALWGCKLTMS